MPPPPGNTVLAVIYILVVHFVHENNVLARNFTDTCWQMMILESEAPQPQPLPNNIHLNLNLNCVLAMNRLASKRHEIDAMYTRWSVAFASAFRG